MKEFFLDTFEYNYTSNQKIIALIEANPNAYSERTAVLIGHTINAQSIWNHRIQGTLSPLGVWDVFKISELAELDTQNHLNSKNIINLCDLKKEVKYANSKGDFYLDRIGKILFHIINHSTYHRGQLITELKTQGVPPIYLDYIFFKR